MPQMSKVKKAVFPVAGLGTRLLPATKTIPKEMLTIVDRPALDYVVEEAREAGIEHFVFVNGRNKHVIEDYFDDQSELYDNLERRGKTDILKRLKELQPAPGKTSFTRQQQPHGLGHAVWCARDIIGNEPFALLLPDMIMQQSDGTGCLAGMMDLHASEGGNVIAVQECDPGEAHKYGIVGCGKEKSGGFEITEMVEKPEKGTAPSNLYINGRYILQPEIFGILETQERGAGNEIQLTDAMKTLSADGSFFGYVFEGQTYDCGSPQGFIEANVAMAMARADLRESVAATLRAYL